MTVDVRAVAIRFADLWAVDPHQMVDEIYADDIEMENMASPAKVVLGSEQLHAVEDRLAAMVPEHRHELIRVIVDRDMACLETTIVSPTTHEYAPACVWWWLDNSGKVAAEATWFNWEDRSTDSLRSHGTVPAGRRAHAARRDPAWHVTMAEGYVRGWSNDPAGSALEMFAPDCTFGHVGSAESTGLEALRQTRQHAIDGLPAPRRMQLQRVIGDGSAVAMLITIDDATHVTRGSVVVTFDSNDLIVSERSYYDWSKALPRAEPGSRRNVGSPGWTLRGR